MEIRIGLTDTPQVLELELAEDTDAEALKRELDSVIGGTETIWLTDKEGNQYGVSATKVSFVKIGVASSARRIGFGV